MDSRIIGYTASTTSILAFGFQFVHTLRCDTIEGISLSRTVFDTASLSLWVVYATRIEDIPLLIACSCELILSFSICLVILHHHVYGSCATLQNATVPTVSPKAPPLCDSSPIESPGNTGSAEDLPSAIPGDCEIEVEVPPSVMDVRISVVKPS